MARSSGGGCLMHRDVEDWVRWALERSNAEPWGHVLEMGSRDWNGSIRHQFLNAEYTGVDLEAGPGVDIVADCADLSAVFETASCDVVLCLEVLEHTDKKAAILREMFRLLRPGGVGILTAGAPGRPKHDGGTDIYENLEPGWLLGKLAQASAEWGIEVGPNEAGTPDIRAWWRR